MDEVVEVVFSTNEGFYNYTYVAIASLINNVGSASVNIMVLVTDVSEKTIQILEGLSQNNVTIKCHSLLDLIKKTDLRGIKHLTPEALYRLYIPLVRPGVKKVLYLDSDIVVRRNILDLYREDLGDKIVGVVEECKTIFMWDHGKHIGMNNPDNMFNSGVLLMNCELFERFGVRDKSLELLKNDYNNDERRYIFLDQDLLNNVLEKKVKYLDKRWNVQVQYYNRLFLIQEQSKTEYLNLFKDPWIIHFAGGKKPWNNFKVPLYDVFWKEVKKTDRALDIFEEEFIKEVKAYDELDCFSRFKFPYSKISADSSIVLYGAGGVGRDFYKQINQTRFAKIILWVDRTPERAPMADVKGVDVLLENNEYDYLLIAIENRDVAESARQELIKMGVCPEKIVWEAYTI